MLGWWAVSDIAKYLRRGSLFEAIARIDAVREHALRLFAVGSGIPYPAFGLTSVLDFPPFELPETLADTYARPDERQSVVAAAVAVADLLAVSAGQAATVVGTDLATPREATVRARLESAVEAADA